MAEDDRPTVLVTGASGFIGGGLVARLLEMGRRVVVITRAASRAFPDGVRIHVGDLATGFGLSSSLFEDVGVVFHCAGEVRQPALMRPVHVGGTERLLACVGEPADPAAPRLHWVQLSSVGAYGPPAPANRLRHVDEETPEHPVGEYEITKTESDDLVRRAAQQGRITCTLLRPSSVIGRRMPNASVRGVIAAVGRGWFFHIGPPGAIAQYVHVDDVVSALVACGGNPAARGQTFNISSDCPWKDMIEHIARARGVSPPRIRLPETPTRLAVGLAGTVLPLPLSASRIDALVSRTSYASAKIEAMLGFRFSRPMPGALDDLLAVL
jgi:nucleoside-diphosphate-sugar epimerase